MNSGFEIIQTEDGNPTIFSTEFQSTYHSTHGSLTESKHIFIQENLNIVSANHATINIFELGLGTGLNACLSMEFATHNKIPIIYHCIEKYPLSDSILSQLKFDSSLDEYYHKIHHCEWGKTIELSEYFTILKIIQDFETYPIIVNHYDSFFMDAFGPEHQPNLWTSAVLNKIYGALKSGGIMTTFSAKGSVRRELISLGFDVLKIDGPPGKRHIIRAIKH